MRKSCMHSPLFKQPKHQHTSPGMLKVSYVSSLNMNIQRYNTCSYLFYIRNPDLDISWHSALHRVAEDKAIKISGASGPKCRRKAKRRWSHMAFWNAKSGLFEMGSNNDQIGQWSINDDKCIQIHSSITLFIIILTDRTSLEISPMKNSQLPMRDEGRLAWCSCHVMLVSILLCRTSRLAPMGAGGASDRPRGSLLPHRRISHLWVAAGSFRWSRQCECQATSNKPDGMKHIETWHAVLVAVRFPSSAIPRLLIW